MPRALVAASAVVASALLVCGCTSNPVQPRITPTPVESPGPASGPQFPTCDQVTAALGGLVGELTYNPAASVAQTSPEAYPQAVCIYTTADAVTQLGVTMAAISFQQAEIDGYATLPNAIADDRTTQYKAVIQTLAPGDIDDGILDSALYLFDTSYSVTIQGLSTGDPIPVSMPQLTVAAAIDAAFGVRALVG